MPGVWEMFSLAGFFFLFPLETIHPGGAKKDGSPGSRER